VRRPAIILLGWGAWLGVLTAVQAPFGPRAIEVEMLGGASAACLLAGGVLWLLDARAARTRQGRQQRQGVRAPERALLSDSSVASAGLVCGLALTLLGAGFGLWLILIGAGVTALGAGGLARETRARRRALEDRGSR
jgi:hypothetical protein